MESDTWRGVLVAALLVNAATGFGYRVYRYRKGGPKADVLGQAILGVLLTVLAAALALGAGWPRWGALAYALLFGVVVMPLWVLAVLIPMRPRGVDYAFTATYWGLLVVIAVAVIAG
ncbi:MAG TPA: hypothetical protein VG318_10955 [Actinomycetota bacterium]|nr:hypothetical protein [Actinomycetota bacterium]